MCLEAGITIICSDEIVRGGLRKLYLINKDAVTTFTPGVLQDYTAVSVGSTGASYEWHEFEFQDETGGLTEDQAINDNGSKPITTTVTATMPRQERVKALALQALIDCCGVIAIVESFSGEAFVVGYDEVVKAFGTKGAVNGEIGPTLDDNNAYIMRLEGKQYELPRQYVGDIVTTGGVTVTFTA